MMRPREGHGVRMEACSFAISLPPSAEVGARSPRKQHRPCRFHRARLGNGDRGQFHPRCLREKTPSTSSCSRMQRSIPFPTSRNSGESLLLFARTSMPATSIVSATGSFLFGSPARRSRRWSCSGSSTCKFIAASVISGESSEAFSPPAETLENNGGSCRDFATLFMEACRFLGFAARFVSGYMYSAEIQGRMSMHGWAEIYLPGAGWIGFDPSWGTSWPTPTIFLPPSRDTPSTRRPSPAPTLGTPRAFLRSDVDLYVKRLDVSPLPDLNFENAVGILGYGVGLSPTRTAAGANPVFV